ncbi:hypothetical protein VM1G_03526 [Cytospora mali]|uniref:Pre-rRNA processing protein n=1 Tax=Cytospora mali TaxID=578113 RepID=A0A194VSR5_CYTMA|nr:hypothetical protein VM1G_03526 [Valsa mali]
MTDSERSPLLSAEDASRSHNTEPGTESTPLLSGGRQADADGASVRSHRSNRSTTKPRPRWPSIIAMAILGLLTVAIIFGAFFVPSAVEEYAKEAAVLEPTALSLESITTNGVRARIQANFKLDKLRVENEHVRRVGSATTWFVRKLSTDSTQVNVYLPEYGDILLGSLGLPPLTININGDNTVIDFVAELMPGEADSIRTIANEWLEGRLGRLRVQGKADITLRTGIIPLGTHAVSESLTFEASDVPGIPQYNITKVLFRDIDNHTVAADVSVHAENKYPVEVVVPPLAFEILVPNCGLNDPYILVAEALTDPVGIRPRQEVVANVHGVIRELPDSLTRVCPNSGSSPLDRFLKDYLGGKSATVFVQGKKRPGLGTPQWVDELLSQVIVPIPFPGRTFDNVMRNFSLTDAQFSLPDPLADPDEANPTVSGTINVIAGLPKEMNFGINVTRVRATADVFYEDRKLGVLDIRRWQAANSTRMESGTDGPELKIISRIENAPLNVTDGDVLTDVLQALLFQGKMVQLDVKALVAVKVQTVLGTLVLKDVPAEGMIPVKPPLKGPDGPGTNPLNGLNPKVGNIMIMDTTPDSLEVRVLVNVTNPTPYAAHVPYVNVHVLCNGSVIGEVTARDLDITTGNNTNLIVTAKWDPSLGGAQAHNVARDLLSQYISGWNTSLSVRAHRDSFPSQPILGEALSHFNLTISTPRLHLPGDDDNTGGDGSKKGHFIRDATFHLLGSTATFTLVSPLKYNTIYIEHINATAFYRTDPVGRIIYEYPIAAPPGSSQTPKLPVDWSIGSGDTYDKIKKALGGSLKLDAKAVVGVKIGAWRETVWYEGKGIGASVRL